MGLHLCPLREIRVPLPGYGTAAARAALPIPISVDSIFVCSDNGMAPSVWDFLTYAQIVFMRLHTGDCADTVRESARKVVSGREKNPLLHRGFEPASVLRLAFQSDAPPTELSPPQLSVFSL